MIMLCSVNSIEKKVDYATNLLYTLIPGIHRAYSVSGWPRIIMHKRKMTPALNLPEYNTTKKICWIDEFNNALILNHAGNV